MYCHSCQTKLSARDQRCPTCGRLAGSNRELGVGSASPDSQADHPLPPASSLEEDSVSQSQPRPKAAPSKESKQKPKEAQKDPRKAGDRRRPSAPAPVDDPEVEKGLGVQRQDVVTLLA